jgi:hypothetical protein
MENTRMKTQGTSNIPQALEFEALTAAGKRLTAQVPVSSRLYAVVGRHGLWRRIARTSRGVNVRQGSGILALFGRAIIELVRDREAEAELLQAGFAIPSAVTTPTTTTSQQSDSATAADNGVQAHPVVPISQLGKPSQPIPSQPRKPSLEPPEPVPALRDEENQDVPPMTAAEILAQHGQVSQREQEYG